MNNNYPKFLSRWIKPFINPQKTIEGFRNLSIYVKNYIRYASMADTPILLKDSYPQLHDRTEESSFDAHYYYSTIWAFQKILDNRPKIHLDIASNLILSGMLSKIVPVIYLDFRPLLSEISGLFSVNGDILHLPFGNDSFNSISCLHVIEHIGLGRYGDRLNTLGTENSISELVRILRRNGNLFLCLPIGRQRTCFDAHRVFSPGFVISRCKPLSLIEFSVIDDQGRFLQETKTDLYEHSDYACGLFWFRKG